MTALKQLLNYTTASSQQGSNNTIMNTSKLYTMSDAIYNIHCKIYSVDILILNPIRYVIYYEKIDPLPSKWNCINFNVGRGVRLGWLVVEVGSVVGSKRHQRKPPIFNTCYILYAVYMYMYMSLINL